MNARLTALALVAVVAVVGAPAAARAPAGRPIVFLSDWPTNLRAHQIYLVGAAGGLRAVGDQAVLPGDSPSWSPDGRRLVFSSFPDPLEAADLWIFDREGKGLTQLTEYANAFTPAWSPDGSRIAFVVFGNRYETGRPPEIWTAGADGRGERQVADHAYEPSWSPDSGSIAFGHNTAAGWELAVVRADGSGLRAVTPPVGPQVRETSWSHDGTRIAYVLEPQGRDGDVHVVGADGSGDVDLTRGASRDASPVWSPDGHRLALVRAPLDRSAPRIVTVLPDGSGEQTVRTLPAGTAGVTLTWSSANELAFSALGIRDGYFLQVLGPGGHPRPLSGREEIDPAWSPDGRRLAVARFHDGVDGDLYLLDAQGVPVRRVTRLEGDESEPAWSPDGRSLVFVRSGTGVWGICTIRTDGRGLRRLTNDFADEQPAWGTGPRPIAFEREGVIYVMRTDGSGIRPLARGKQPDWSPDGHTLAFDHLQIVYVLDLATRKIRRLTSGTAPTWSADGKRLLVVDRRGGDNDLFVIGADGRGRRLLTNDFADELEPDW